MCCFRCVRVVGRRSHRKSAGKVAVRPGGVLPHPVPKPADALRQAAAAAAVAAHRQLASDRATFLRAAGGQDADRDADQGHAAQRQLLFLALHELHVTLGVAPDRVLCPAAPALASRLRLRGLRRPLFLEILTHTRDIFVLAAASPHHPRPDTTPVSSPPPPQPPAPVFCFGFSLGFPDAFLLPEDTWRVLARGSLSPVDIIFC